MGKPPGSVQPFMIECVSGIPSTSADIRQYGPRIEFNRCLVRGAIVCTEIATPIPVRSETV